MANNIIQIPQERLQEGNRYVKRAALHLALNSANWLRKVKLLENKITKMLAFLPLVENRTSYADSITDLSNKLSDLYEPQLKSADISTADSKVKSMVDTWNKVFGKKDSD